MPLDSCRPSEAPEPTPPSRYRAVARPWATVRCRGRPFFRSPSVRNYGQLLDVDPDVISWVCRPPPIPCGELLLEPDFAVVRNTGQIHVIIDDGGIVVPPEDWMQADVLQVVDPQSLDPDRLANAQDLTRYASWRIAMSDRIRILSTLDSEGSLTLGECLSIRTSCDPIAAIAALALRREVEIDLDSGRIGPETRVTRIRD